MVLIECAIQIIKSALVWISTNLWTIPLVLGIFAVGTIINAKNR